MTANIESGSFFSENSHLRDREPAPLVASDAAHWAMAEVPSIAPPGPDPKPEPPPGSDTGGLEGDDDTDPRAC